MIRRIGKRFLSLFLIATLLMGIVLSIPAPIFAAEILGLSEDRIVLDSQEQGVWTASSTSIEGVVDGKTATCEGNTAQDSAITIKSNAEDVTKLFFDLSILKNSGQIKVNDEVVTANNTFEFTLDPGDAVEIYIQSGEGPNNKTEVKLINIALVADIEVTTTFLQSENGSYTVNGEEITAEYTNTANSSFVYSVEATPNPGYKIVGWLDESKNEYLSFRKNAIFRFDSPHRLKAVFISDDTPLFSVGKQVFADLNEANTYAVDNELSKITLISDGALLSGQYTISSGVTLLIPFDDARTTYTTSPEHTSLYVKPTPYSTLTLASGAVIDVEGSLSVSAKHFNYGQTAAGAPSGKTGNLVLNSGSAITVKEGGALYAYGFITGGGTVTAKSGSTVYENMQINDFKGGSATSSMVNNKWKIFPINQYFVQNIESELILEAGAEEYLYTSITAANTTIGTTIPFFGSTEAMFSVDTGGTMAKKYLPSEDRLQVDVRGDARINSLALELAGVNLSSENYVLPINNGMTINVLSGTTEIGQDAALLAGSVLNIEEDAVLDITNASSAYIYDRDEWIAQKYAGATEFKTVHYSPSRTYRRVLDDLIDAEINVNGTLKANGHVYTTAGGANIRTTQGTGQVSLVSGAGTEEFTYQYVGNSTTVSEIPITSVKLRNAEMHAGTDKEFTSTATAEEGSIYRWNQDEKLWTLREKVEISFDSNGGTGEMLNLNPYTDEDVRLVNGFTAQEHYIFSGWNTNADGTGEAYNDTDMYNFTEDTLLYAQWEAKQYTVTWKNYNGEVLSVNEVKYNTVPKYDGSRPTKESTAEFSYEFTGWSPELSPIDSDMEYTAQFEESTNHYTVRWLNEDGSVLYKDEEVEYGSIPVFEGEDPTKEEDDQYSYEFAGWTPNISAVTDNVDYTATFLASTNTYTIKWLNEDGSELLVQEGIEYGAIPSYEGDTPLKEADAQYTYTFKGWEPEVVAVTGHATYIATYNEEVNYYTVIWKDDVGNILEETILPFGEMPVYGGETPTKEETEQFSYIFQGWDPVISEVTEDVIYTAIFEEKLKTYSVTWVDDDGLVLQKDEEVEYGSIPVFEGEEPTKEEDDQYSYEFEGWDPAVGEITGDMVYTAKYKKTVKSYIITWKDEDGTVLRSESVEYGETPSYGENPSKAADEKYSYVFSGWTPEVVPVTGDVTYRANYTKTPQSYVVSFDANGGEGAMDAQTFLYGQDQNLKLNTFVRDNYIFGGWNTLADGEGATYANGASIINLTENIVLYAQWLPKGWHTDENGTSYYEDGEKKYFDTWALIDENKYFFNDNGYIVKGLYKTLSEDGEIEATFLFDPTTGIFQENLSGLYDFNQDTFLIDSGKLVEFAGLVKINDDYYYFGEDHKAVKNESVLVTKTNGLFPEAVYEFDEEGKMVPLKHGIVSEDEGLYYYEYGKLVYAGLIELDDNYYYVTTSGKLVQNRDYWITKTNGLLPEQSYSFDEEGRIITAEESLNGIVEENGKLYYYENGIRIYAGLIKIEEDYYYVRTNGQLVQDRAYWITKTNGLLPEKSYSFDSEGKAILPDANLNGIVEENGELYYYENGVKVYAGLIELSGEYYYVRTSGKLVQGRDYWITKTNGLLPEQSYSFDESGKLIKADENLNGIVAEEDSLFYYDNGIRTYAGLIQIDGYYYYVRTSGELVQNRNYWITKTNGLLPEKSYTFDSEGKIINP